MSLTRAFPREAHSSVTERLLKQSMSLAQKAGVGAFPDRGYGIGFTEPIGALKGCPLKPLAG